ncbi:MAG: RNA 2',3'-cyclic phosphodiesterase, partial [Candidatus Edwardsbacteria bacterium]|nr:RNA 2',3'-cyclic phosphodiesterase [Candidatus Edwardsbacteria bacterium]
MPEDIRRYLGSLTDILKRSGADVKWVTPENIHLTLKFLGATTPAQAEAVKSQLRELQGKYPPVPASLNALGAFPNAMRPQVVWAGMDASGKILDELYNDIEQRMETAGFTKEKRRFAPHLTLGRVRSTRNAAVLSRAMDQIKIVPHAFAIRSLTLLKSDLTPAGAVYQPLMTIELR